MKQKQQQKKSGSSYRLPLALGGIGICLYWLGMIWAFHGTNLHLGPVALAIAGLLLVISAYPIRIKIEEAENKQ